MPATPAWALGTGRRTWHFVLPESGQHTLRTEGLGTAGMDLRIDGEALASWSEAPGFPQGAGFLFSGPSDSNLELKCLDLRTRHWVLDVNGMRVEEMVEAPTKFSLKMTLGPKLDQESLRGSMKLPDGSYTIAAQFDAENLSYRLNVIRKFRFYTGGTRHEVGISHTLPGIWQLTIDGRLSERKSHGSAESSGFLDFDVPIGTDKPTPSSASRGETVRARMEMEYNNWKMVWSYRVFVNRVEVPCCWRKAQGYLPGVPVPQVLSEEFMAENGIVGHHEEELQSVQEDDDAPKGYGPALGEEISAPAEEDNDEREGGEDLAPEPRGEKVTSSYDFLPQGVSFDPETGVYQANIKNRAGKFVFLGEFMSVEEAHQKYLEALPIHSPEKHVYADPVGG